MNINKENRFNETLSSSTLLVKARNFFQIAIFSVILWISSNSFASNSYDTENKDYTEHVNWSNSDNSTIFIITLISLAISLWFNIKQKIKLLSSDKFLIEFEHRLSELLSWNTKINFTDMISYTNDEELIALLNKLQKLQNSIDGFGVKWDIIFYISKLNNENNTLKLSISKEKQNEELLASILSLWLTEKDNWLKNLESLQSSWINSVTALHAAIDILNVQISKLKQNWESLDQILLQIKDLTDLIFSFSTLVDEVNSKISWLFEFSNQIKHIAKEIKFLSINASIEASKIWDQWKGFKVVWNRVKELSDTASELASSIDLWLTDFREWFNKYFLEQFLEIKKKTEAVSECIWFIRNSFDATTHSMVDTNRQLEYVESLFFISLVKVDHIVFKQIAYKFVTDKSWLSVEEREIIKKTHKECRLWCWYDKERKWSVCDSVHAWKWHSKHSSSPLYSKLDKPHAMFHQLVASIIKIVESWDWKHSVKDYKKLEQLFQKAENCSLEIFNLLDNLLSERTSDLELF